MKRLLPIPLLFLLVACGSMSVAPGNDPVVVDAEKTTSVAVESLNTFFKLEASNHALVKQKLPKVADWTNYARANAPKWIATARDTTKAYKANRTSANKASLQTAVAVLAEAINQVHTYTAQIGSLTP
jgi:hypothetical protein